MQPASEVHTSRTHRKRRQHCKQDRRESKQKTPPDCARRIHPGKQFRLKEQEQ